MARREGFAGELQQWEQCEGTWERRASPNDGVLVQTGTDRAFPLAPVEAAPVSGKVDAARRVSCRFQPRRSRFAARDLTPLMEESP